MNHKTRFTRLLVETFICSAVGLAIGTLFAINF
jgi:hypothetical protein